MKFWVLNSALLFLSVLRTVPVAAQSNPPKIADAKDSSAATEPEIVCFGSRPVGGDSPGTGWRSIRLRLSFCMLLLVPRIQVSDVPTDTWHPRMRRTAPDAVNVILIR
jgi:hypothetical protein